MSKWLAQCLGDKDGYEVSLVLSSNTHGQESYGWFGEDKVLIGEGGSEGELLVDDTDAPEIVAKWRAEEKEESDERQRHLDKCMNRARLMAQALNTEQGG